MIVNLNRIFVPSHSFHLGELADLPIRNLSIFTPSEPWN